jgi:hypothetical protein
MAQLRGVIAPSASGPYDGLMSSSPTTPDTVVRPHPKRIARAKDWLTRAIRSRTPEQTERRLDVILDWAYSSVAHAEAIYAAVQELRDLRELEPDEAACLCGEVYDIRSERFMTHDPAYQRILARYADATLIDGEADGAFEATTEALQSRALELEASYHAARGEARWAAMLRRNPGEFRTLVAEGECNLVKTGELIWDDEPLDDPDPEQTALIGRRIMALSASETLRAAFDISRVFQHTIQSSDRASGVAAVRQLREVGAISRAEWASLIDDIVVTDLRSAMECDREMMQRERELQEAKEANGVTGWPEPEDDALPADVRVLKKRYEQRSLGIQATLLRRVGEHELANLVLEDAAEYDRLVEEGAFGGITERHRREAQEDVEDDLSGE